MSFAYFAVFSDAAKARPRLDARDEAALVKMVSAVPHLTRALVFTPSAATDPYLDDGASPPLAFELYFDSLDALEAAVGRSGPLQALARADALPSMAGTAVTQQAMVVRSYRAPDPTFRVPARGRHCTYLVEYPGPAEDLNEWLACYIPGHADVMKTFPGIREIEICTRCDWSGFLPWPRAESMLRNKVVFDSPEALTAALQSPVRHAMRDHFKAFPPFRGGNTHFPMATLEVRPS